MRFPPSTIPGLPGHQGMRWDETVPLAQALQWLPYNHECPQGYCAEQFRNSTDALPLYSICHHSNTFEFSTSEFWYIGFFQNSSILEFARFLMHWNLLEFWYIKIFVTSELRYMGISWNSNASEIFSCKNSSYTGIQICQFTRIPLCWSVHCIRILLHWNFHYIRIAVCMNLLKFQYMRISVMSEFLNVGIWHNFNMSEFLSCCNFNISEFWYVGIRNNDIMEFLTYWNPDTSEFPRIPIQQNFYYVRILLC